MSDSKYFGSCFGQEKYPKITTISGFRRIIYRNFNDENNKNKYTVLLVGGSRCGKSTIIDAIANFFMGKNSPKNEIIHVTKDTIVKVDQADIDDFCIYTFFTNDAVFNFIDSPSITNEAGFIDENVKRVFQRFIDNTKGNCDININAVGFVIQNHFVRLQPAEEEMLKFVTGLLGNNINHLIPFITFTDASTPPVLEALQSVGIDTRNHLVFNNVCFNISPNKINKLIEIYWEDGFENIQKGIDIIIQLGPVDLLNVIEQESYPDWMFPSVSAAAVFIGAQVGFGFPVLAAGVAAAGTFYLTKKWMEK